MSTGQYVWIGIGLALVVVIGCLDIIKRKRIADAEARMSPQEREIARKEAKAFQGIWRQEG